MPVLVALWQEFINHGGVIYKVYVIGDQRFVVRRPSVRDMPPDTPLLQFHSHDMRAVRADPPEEAAGARPEGDGPGEEVVRELCSAIGRAQGLSLYGLDLIVASGPVPVCSRALDPELWIRALDPSV